MTQPSMSRHQIRNVARRWAEHLHAARPDVPEYMRHAEAVEALLGAMHGYADLVERALEKHRDRAHGGAPGDPDCVACGFYTAGVYQVRTGRNLAEDMETEAKHGESTN